MDESYFAICCRRRAKVRWLSKALKVSRFIDVDNLADTVNEKLARIEKRRGKLDEALIAQIGENLILAKVAKRYIERRIKPYDPKVSRRSPTHRVIRSFPSVGFDFHQSKGPVFKEKNYRLKNHPSVLFPGFMPDGNEAFFLLRKCFLKFGSVYYFNYQTRHFYKETILCQMYDTIMEINNRNIKNAGQKRTPFLVATSFGCHILINFLRWLRQHNLEDTLSIKGIVMISPVVTAADVIDPTLTRQKTLVGRAVKHLIDADQENPEEIRAAMQKAKSIMLKMFTSGRDLMQFESKDLIPIFAIEDDVLDVFRKEIEEDDGYFRRFLELRDEPELEESFLTAIPTLVLMAEGEMDVLAPESPTYKTLANIEALQKIFPNGTVELVRSKSDTRKVTHSDLIFQADRFAEHLDYWLSRITK